MKFRKKSVVIDAFQWQPGVPASDSPSWYREACTAQMIWGVLSGGCLIRSPDGTQFAKPGDWILRDSKGNLHRCKPDIFAATYEPADVPAPALTQDVQTRADIRKLAHRLQQAAYRHGEIDSSDRWSSKKYGDADDQSRAALKALLDRVDGALNLGFQATDVRNG